MLLVCAGPDTFQAFQKAQELERAYREKYDPQGLSVERLASVGKGLEHLAERLGSVGLFAQRRCVRLTGAVSAWKKAEWERAAKLFARDPEQSIVISVEEELGVEAERLISGWERSRVYRFPLLSGTAFQRLAAQLARSQEMEFVPALQAFAQAVDGDTWAFWNALPRWKATQTLPETAAVAGSPFAKSDRYLLGTSLEGCDEGEDLSPFFLQQARQGLRVLAGQPDPKMPAFVQKKWQAISPMQKNHLFQRVTGLVEWTVSQRLGGANPEDQPFFA